MFQSSPGQKAGCNRETLSCPLLATLFQSSPGQKAGCNLAPTPASKNSWYVSILTRPEGRMQSVY